MPSKIVQITRSLTHKGHIIGWIATNISQTKAPTKTLQATEETAQRQ